MPIRAELSGDRDRGPGYGRLRISGLRVTGRIDFAVMQNQGTEPYLGRNATWQAAEVWHTSTEIELLGDDVIVPVGPPIVDPIVNRGVSAAFRLVVAADAAKEQGVMKIGRGLLGSGAAAPEVPRGDAAGAEPPLLPAVAEPPPQPIDPEETVAPPQPTPRRGGRLIAAVATLLVAAAAAGAWYTCLIPGFGAARCTGATPAPAAVAAPAGGRSCANLDAAACLQVARDALAAHELEPARQLFQQAAQLGSAEADTAIARMYDPATWSAESSPSARADWETAVYWYETAARKNDVAGKLGAGRLLCDNASSDFERKRGVEFLRAAADSGSAEAQPLIAACEAKVGR